MPGLAAEEELWSSTQLGCWDLGSGCNHLPCSPMLELMSEFKGSGYTHSKTLISSVNWLISA